MSKHRFSSCLEDLPPDQYPEIDYRDTEDEVMVNREPTFEEMIEASEYYNDSRRDR